MFTFDLFVPKAIDHLEEFSRVKQKIKTVIETPVGILMEHTVHTSFKRLQFPVLLAF